MRVMTIALSWLKSFLNTSLFDSGHVLIDDSYEWIQKTIKEKDTLVEKFVDKFVYQISILIGKQPRIVKVGESNEYVLYDIHYE